MLFALLIIISFIMGQGGTIKGFVYDNSNGEPVFSANVFLKETTYGAVTDLNGFFIITNVPPGKYIIMVSFLGYETIFEEIEIKEKQIITKKFYIKEKPVSIQEVRIEGEKYARETMGRVSYTRIKPAEIAQLPSIGGLPDIAQYLQILPGVTITGDIGGQLYIRGGAPIQNKFIFDGMTIFNPFHSIGAFSVFDVNTIKMVDVYRGGFNAEYGDRISSIINIKTIEGNRKRVQFDGNITTMGTSLLAQVPLIKATQEREGSGSFILSVKHSWADKYAKYVYKFFPQMPELPYFFTDVYGKISFTSKQGHNFWVSAINFLDEARYPLATISWINRGASTGFLLVPDQTQTNFKVVLSYSNYLIKMKEANFPQRNNNFSSFDGQVSFVHYRSQNELNFGFDFSFLNTSLDFYTPTGGKISFLDNSTNLGGFAKYKLFRGINKKFIKSIIWEPGMRIQYYASLDAFSIEPRIQFKWVINDYLRWKLGGGYYSQNIFSATTEKDVISIFPAILSGDVNIPSKIVGRDSSIIEIKYPLQKAQHIVGGIEIEPPLNLFLEIEGYLKNYSMVIEINRDKQFDDVPENILEPDRLKKDFWIETGITYGVDILAKWQIKRLEATLSYSFAINKRYDENKMYYPVFDRRHTINTFLTYKFGAANNWEASIRWTFGSGFPFTPTVGFFPLLTLSYPSEDYLTQNEKLGIFLDEPMSKRLPSYHRFDASLSYSYAISEKTTLSGVLSIINVYNQKNILYYDRITNQVIYQLPFLLNFGLKLSL